MYIDFLKSIYAGKIGLTYKEMQALAGSFEMFKNGQSRVLSLQLGEIYQHLKSGVKSWILFHNMNQSNLRDAWSRI